MSAKIDNERLSFFDLPPEIRNRIYRGALSSPCQPIRSSYGTPSVRSKLRVRRGSWSYIMGQHFHTTFRKKPGPCRIRRLTLRPQLLQLCKVVHCEATPVLYGSNRFHLSSDTMRIFMTRIGPNSVAYLRDLQLERYPETGRFNELRWTLRGMTNADSLQRLRFNIRGFRRWTPRSIANALEPLMDMLHVRAKCGKGKDAMQVLEFRFGQGPPDKIAALRRFDNEVRQLLQARLERKKSARRQSK